MSSTANLLDQLPHRPPFRFITGQIELSQTTGTAVWSVDGDEQFLKGHFPGTPIVPGVLIGEALAQLSGLVALERVKHQAAGDSAPGLPDGRLAHLDLRWADAVYPPAEIYLRSNLVRVFGSLWQFDVEAVVETKRVARGQLTLSITDRESTGQR